MRSSEPARNTHFSHRALGVVLEPSRWRLVSSLCPSDITPIADRVHAVWTRRHPHTHAHREIMMALEGQVPYGHRGTVYACRPGTVMLFEPMDPHDMNYPARGRDFVHLWIHVFREHFSADLITRRHGRLRRGLMRRLFAQTQGLLVLEQYWTDLQARSARSPRLARLRFFSALAAMVARIVEAGYEQTPVPDRYAFQEQVVSAVQHHIAKTAGKGVNLDHLARLAGYSKYHFHRLFKKIAGLSPKSYVDVCRIDRMREMEEDGSNRTQIAEALGFSCLAAFSRWRKGRRNVHPPARQAAGSGQSRSSRASRR